MNQIIIKDINLGGISDSLYQGQKNSVSEICGFDIHSSPGLLKNNQKLSKENGTTVIDDLIKTILPCSDGYTYLFGSTNGKVWRRDSSGAYTLQVTVAPAAGAVGVMDAYEYQGYIYYSMQSRLGRVAVGAPTNWAGRDDSWKTFTNTDASFHPMNEVNQVLYIGDGFYLSQVDAGVFTADALDLASPFRIKALGRVLTDILIGTFVNIYKVATQIFRWNTWSTDSYQSSDDIPEIGINCFLKTDNYNLVNAGTKGNIYLYNGSQLDNFKRIPGDWSGTKEAYVHPNASCNMFGLPLFGLSNVTSNPAKQGVYSLGGYDRNYPKVLNLEWLISTDNSSGVDIGAIELVGTVLLVSWKDTTGTTTYGVDKIDLTAKVVSAYFATRVVNIARNDSKTLSGYVAYRSLPNDATIKIYYKVNYATSWTEADTIVDTIRKTVYLDKAFPEANTIQIKVESNAATGANVNNAPEIESAEFLFE
jgi:hypothetical protein